MVGRFRIGAIQRQHDRVTARRVVNAGGARIHRAHPGAERLAHDGADLVLLNGA